MQSEVGSPAVSIVLQDCSRGPYLLSFCFIEVTNLMILILAIPLCAVASRRLHDTGKSGWWSLLALTGIGILPLLVWCATDTKQKDNKYGPLEQS